MNLFHSSIRPPDKPEGRPPSKEPPIPINRNPSPPHDSLSFLCRHRGRAIGCLMPGPGAPHGANRQPQQDPRQIHCRAEGIRAHAIPPSDASPSPNVGHLATFVNNHLLAHELWLNALLLSSQSPEDNNSSSNASGSPRILHRFESRGFNGYAGSFPTTIVDEIRRRPEVAFVESDQEMHIMNEEYLISMVGQKRHLDGMHMSKEPSVRPAPSLSSLAKRFKNPEERLVASFFGWLNRSSEAQQKGKRAEARRPSVNNSLGVQRNAPWGLGRIAGQSTKSPAVARLDRMKSSKPQLSQRSGPPSSSGPGSGSPPSLPPRPLPPPSTFLYRYPSSAGEGVTVYIIDTGIDVKHEEFEGRAKWGITIPEMEEDVDGNGHGTHCAGIVGSKSYGVAKKATIVAVKVLRSSGFGSNIDIIKGIEWVMNEHARRVSSDPQAKTVINMSLGGGRSIALDYLVNEAVKLGIHFTVAAGNDTEDACMYSPAAAERAITVGASTVQDSIAFFSNHGACVDIFAPGLDITSTWIEEQPEDELPFAGGPQGRRRPAANANKKTISGTSMASPHIAGIVALYLGEQNYEPAALKDLLIEHAQKGILTDLPEMTQNRLASTAPMLAAIG